jgi:hypothetical protein
MKVNLFTAVSKVKVLVMEVVLMVASASNKLDIKSEFMAVIIVVLIPQKIGFSVLGVMTSDKRNCPKIGIFDENGG